MDQKDRLVKLMLASSGANRTGELEARYVSLDDEALVIELARLYLRYEAPQPLSHRLFAEFLGLEHGRAYRALLDQKGYLRDQLLLLCRSAVKLRGKDVLSQVRRLTEYHRWTRSIGLDERRRLESRGRPREASMYAVPGSDAERLEGLRLQSGLGLKRWAQRLGTSENTYRRKLVTGPPADWVPLALQLQQQLDADYRKTDLIARLLDGELPDAMDRAWSAYERSVGAVDQTAINIGPAAPLPIQVEAPVELELFEPSDEEDLE